ncbi:MAG: DNA methyltransferase [Bacteroidales bacterium]|jgi:REP element-mobilizing transposase RayT|nr:transposase [Bacteroidales bacterium]
MPLFQSSVLKKYLQDLDKTQVQQAFSKFVEKFGDKNKQDNIRNAKEEQYQEGFLRELFCTVLGYTINPENNYNLTTEYKNEKDAKKADGAILKDNKPVAIIELKGTDTIDLDTVEQQAFNYKNNQSACKYVIISNFAKLRFYIENAIDFEEFDLFNLTQDKFELLYLCLAEKCLLNDIPLAIKQASVAQEENITKKLYNDYSAFKRVLFANIVELNPNYDKLLVYKKTQKLLDRLLFIFFAEDRLLLPPNSIREILKQWETLRELDSYTPLYERFKKYFGYLLTGHKGKQYEIFAYNGGLFEPDDVLDNITIDDTLLFAHLTRLADYNYETEVDVNILGHIFEHSLSEIEQIQAELEGKETDKSKTKRKKDGIFYTPKYITKYIVESTVGALCNEKKNELVINEDEFGYAKRKEKKKKLVEKLDAYRNWLLKLTICDPACGSGAFLVQALNFLIDEHKLIDELQARVLDSSIVFPNIENTILENNLYGVDLNEESVEIAKLSLWLRTAQKGRKLSSLNNNIKCGNSLIDDPAVAGNKAFNWQKEFPNIFKEKKKKIWHITTATHDTRTSQRMVEYRVRQRKADGEMHIDRSICFDEEDSVKITEILCDIITEDALNCLAYNVCYDHIHIILVCEEEELANIVRKLKGKSAQKFKEYKAIASDETFHLWAQKFNKKEITNDRQLAATINYIQTNRIKHSLPDISKGLQPIADNSAANNDLKDPADYDYKGQQPLVMMGENKGLQHFIDKMTCTIEHAFRTEYKGGFDVVIGNPPYAGRSSSISDTVSLPESRPFEIRV